MEYRRVILVKKPAKRWRQRGIKVIHYIDDFAFFCATKAEAEALRKEVLADIMELGLAPNFK